MRVLHIAYLTARRDSGVSTVVPQYFMNEQLINKETYLLNINKNSNLSLHLNEKYLKSNNIKDAIFKIKKIKPDIVVIHEVYYFELLKICKYLCKNKVPYIITPHGCLTKTAQKHKRMKKKLGNILFMNLIKRATSVHYLSNMEKEQTAIRNNNYYVLGNGTKSILENPHRINKNRRFVYIGRLNYYHKGIDLIIEAAKYSSGILRESKASIEIYGSGNNKVKNSIKNDIRKCGLSNIVKVYGPVFGKEKNNIIDSSCAFVQTSRFEGLPMGIIEAMMRGAPIIATEGTGMSKEIHDYNCGIGCKTNAKDVARALESFLTDNREPEFSNNAHKYAVDNYSWEKIAKENLDRYEDISKIN